MAGPRQIWPGAAMRRFFAALLARETSLDEAARDRLAEALSKPIGRLLVYHDPSDGPTAAAGADADAPLPVPVPEPVPAPVPALVAPEPAAEAPTPAAFDPFAFSVVAVLKRSGPAALLERLSAIADADHLRRLADAQHLALAPAGGTPVPDDLDGLRHAIVAGAEARLAERRAAAS